MSVSIIRYTIPSTQDCRWENCQPSFGTHSQMTMTMYAYVPLSASLSIALSLQGQQYASCAAAKLALPNATSGPYSLSSGAGAAVLIWCDMSGAGVSRGGDGSTLANPASDCNTLFRAWGRPSGQYYVTTPQGVKQVYCFMDAGDGGWMLVWKHSYYQVRYV
jgi:hypothetical protein